MLDHLIVHASSLFRYHEETRLNRTNNRDECWNNKLEKYPSLETQEKSGSGVQRICDGMTFLANWDAFKTYIVEMEAKIEKLRTLIGADVGNMDLKPELRGAIAHLRWVRKWQAKYAEIHDRYFKIIPEP